VFREIPPVNSPSPCNLAAEIVEDLRAALDRFAQIAADLGAGERETGSDGRD
jgi:hypothetical protein